jgi:hypothetical protein
MTPKPIERLLDRKDLDHRLILKGHATAACPELQ